MKEKVILAYSGGLDTTALIPWLKENFDYEVICCCVNCGQGNELDGLEERAKLSGASKLYIEDIVDEFCDDYIMPCVEAGAVYEHKYLLGTSMARPVIAKKLVEIARKEGASAIAKSVFDALGAKTYVINNEPDGTNINMNCGSTHIEVLKQFVKDNQLDVGFAYDGDADRCIAVDDKGEEINGDLILYVCGKYMKEQGKLNNNTIVTTIMSNLGLYKACDREGISYEKTAVGDKYVCENMMQNGHSIGGEQSGHIIFSKHATTGDGILTSLKIMEVIIEKKLPLSTLASEVKIYPQVLKNVRVYDKKEARENPEVVKVIKKVEEALGEDGRILVRESGTEPVVRVMVEASTDEICNQYVDEVIAVMRAQNLVQ